MQSTVSEIDKDLLDKYSSGFMYVDYPHKSKWSYEFNENDFKNALKSYCSSGKVHPAMLYVHIPFCSSLCYYCLCHKVITRNYEKIKHYMNVLYREMDLFHDFFDKHSVSPNIKEIHLGGGSPTILKEREFDQLIDKLQSFVDIKNLREFALEIDPRHVDKDRLRYYHSKGINRISFGVQEFNPNVQKAVNRIQGPELILNLLTPDVRGLFKGVNFDILCGLPRQTEESFMKTIDTVIEMSPDRIDLAFVNYTTNSAKHQKLIERSECPSDYENHMFFMQAAQKLLDNGYVRIGFDHFAKPDDEVTVAKGKENLRWNGLGFAPDNCVDIIGVGVNSTSRLTRDFYAQNTYSLSEYEETIGNGRFPILRGYKMSGDDVMRRDIINKLRSYNYIDCHEIEKTYQIVFEDYFRDEKPTLDRFEMDGLLSLTDNKIAITEKGGIFINSICWIFDKYKGSISYPKKPELSPSL